MNAGRRIPPAFWQVGRPLRPAQVNLSLLPFPSMSQTLFLFFLPRVVTPCPSTCSPSATQSSPPPSCFFTPAWTLAAAAAVPPSRSSVVFCMPAFGGHHLLRSHSASTVAWSISLKVFTEETHHLALFLTACFAGHSGVASCAFSSDRGTFSALADGSTTVQDAVTTGQMVRVTASRSTATHLRSRSACHSPRVRRFAITWPSRSTSACG